eukprot:6660753-Prymnesium_polylepis.1
MSWSTRVHQRGSKAANRTSNVQNVRPRRSRHLRHTALAALAGHGPLPPPSPASLSSRCAGHHPNASWNHRDAAPYHGEAAGWGAK